MKVIKEIRNRKHELIGLLSIADYHEEPSKEDLKKSIAGAEDLIDNEGTDYEHVDSEYSMQTWSNTPKAKEEIQKISGQILYDYRLTRSDLDRHRTLGTPAADNDQTLRPFHVKKLLIFMRGASVFLFEMFLWTVFLVLLGTIMNLSALLVLFSVPITVTSMATYSYDPSSAPYAIPYDDGVLVATGKGKSFLDPIRRFITRKSIERHLGRYSRKGRASFSWRKGAIEKYEIDRLSPTRSDKTDDAPTRTFKEALALAKRLDNGYAEEGNRISMRTLDIKSDQLDTEVIDAHEVDGLPESIYKLKSMVTRILPNNALLNRTVDEIIHLYGSANDTDKARLEAVASSILQECVDLDAGVDFDKNEEILNGIARQHDAVQASDSYDSTGDYSGALIPLEGEETNNGLEATS